MALMRTLLLICCALHLSIALAKDDKPDAASRDELFSLDEEEAPKAPNAQAAKKPAKPDDAGVRWGGFLREELAYNYSDPDHWTKILTRAQVMGQGQFTKDLKWKASARLDYDAVFSATNHYSGQVRDDRELNFLLRENYLDWSTGSLDFRLGRQHIVWGEMVGLFFADVVSAKDLREFILPDFDVIRIPQWAARAEYFRGDAHYEVVWIPYVSLDEIGAFGDDFYPSLIPAPGLGLQARDRVTPARSLDNSNIGARASVLINGWDLSAFGYTGIDSSPHFTRSIENLPGPTVVYTPRHSKIWQAGGTLAKDFGNFVVKTEAIYTHGRNFSVTDFNDADGVVKQNLFDYVVGVEFGLRETELSFNVQYFQRIFLNYVASMVSDKEESGVSFQLRGTFGDFQPQLLVIQSLNRNDGLLRPLVDWNFAKNLKLRSGVDIFHGPATGLFGQYNSRDRVYAELRYSF